MITRDYIDDFVERIQLEAADRCLEAATVLQTELKRRYSTSYPPASLPGQYPHGRTWGGRDAVTYTPTTPEEVARIGYVRVGFLKMEFDYMLWLELVAKRKGLFSCYEEIKPTLQRILTGSTLRTSSRAVRPT